MNKWLKVILIGIGLVVATILGLIGYKRIKIAASGLTELEYYYRQSPAFQKLKKDFPLIAAARVGDIDQIKVLLDAGADINQVDVKSEGVWPSGILDIFPLAEAIRAGNEEIVKLLIDRGANVDLQTPNGFSPLMYAIVRNKDTIMPILISAGADIKTGSWIADAVSQNLYSHTNKDSNLKIIKELIAAGAPVDDLTGLPMKEGINNSALAEAALLGRDDLVKLLLDAGANVNLGADKDLETRDKTALHAVSRMFLIGLSRSAQKMDQFLDSHKKIAQLLIDAGAKIDIKDASGNTPLLLASANNHLGVVEVLLKAGADPLIKNNEGKTSLDLVKEIKDKMFFDLLTPETKQKLEDLIALLEKSEVKK